MTQTNSVLSRKTKQEILDEYEKLEEQLEDLRSTAQIVHSQPALELVEKTKSKTPQTIDKLFTDFQASLQAHMMEARTSLLEQSNLLQDFQKAIELSRQQIELQRHISLAADSLDLLVEEHTKRTALFEEESEKRKRELDEQVTAKKKIWEREVEEYEYQKKLKNERDQVEMEEREKAFIVRENTIRTQEQEIVQMKKAIEQFPKEREQALEQCKQEVSDRLNQQFGHEKALLEKETNAQIRLLELTVKNLEDRLNAQTSEFVSLKQQAEEANAKAQALAIKAIERPTTIVTPTNNASSNQPSFHERGQGRSNG